MRPPQCQMCAIFSVFTVFQRQILAGPAGTGNNQALDNRNSGENTIGIDVDARAVIAGPSTENNEPSLITKTYGEDSSSNLKDISRDGGETSSGIESKDKAEKEKWDKIRKRAKKIAEENRKRDAAARAKGFVYELYDPNDIDVV